MFIYRDLYKHALKKRTEMFPQLGSPQTTPSNESESERRKRIVDLENLSEQSQNISQGIASVLSLSKAEEEYLGSRLKWTRGLWSKAIAAVVGAAMGAATLFAGYYYTKEVNGIAIKAAEAISANKGFETSEEGADEEQSNVKADGTEQEKTEKKTTKKASDYTSQWPRVVVFLAVHVFAAALPLGICWLIVRRSDAD